MKEKRCERCNTPIRNPGSKLRRFCSRECANAAHSGLTLNPDPTPDEILERMAEVRKGWTAREHKRRWQMPSEHVQIQTISTLGIRRYLDV
jgi:hypothetical protein